MDTIICLVGPSGTGKTTISKELEKDGYNIIHSYTTRKPREPNEWGHRFIEGDVQLLYKNGRNFPSLVAYEYNGEERCDEIIAYFNNYHESEMYFATREQYENKGISIYVVDPVGAKQVIDATNKTDTKVVIIDLIAPEYVLLERLVTRGLDNGLDLDMAKKEAKARITRDREIFNKIESDVTINVNKPIDEFMAIVTNIFEEYINIK